jgi:hypothetical protein
MIILVDISWLKLEISDRLLFHYCSKLVLCTIRNCIYFEAKFVKWLRFVRWLRGAMGIVII